MTDNKGVMNPVIETIHNRRSIRDYESKPIPRDVLDTIIEAGNRAPFMAELGFQPWRFVVVQDAEFRKKLVQTTHPIWKGFMENMKEAIPGMYEKVMALYEAMDEPKDLVYYSAPAIVFVIGTAKHAICCALACENIMIAATSLGLGSCYVGFGAMVTGNSEVVQALELSDDEQIFGPILLGYPKDEVNAQVDNALSSLTPMKKEPVIKWI
jgi:nitroreductase